MTDTAQVQLAVEPDDDVLWSKEVDGDELRRLLALHPSTLYLTLEDDPRYVMGYIEEVTEFDEPTARVRDSKGRFVGPEYGRLILTLTDPMGIRIIEPDERVLVGVAGLGGGHVGHMSWGGSNWWCDTCNSPLCDLA